MITNHVSEAKGLGPDQNNVVPADDGVKTFKPVGKGTRSGMTNLILELLITNQSCMFLYLVNPLDSLAMFNIECCCCKLNIVTIF